MSELSFYAKEYNEDEHNENMNKMFSGVKRIYLKTCPICGTKIYKANGYIDPTNKIGYVDYVTECECDYEANRKVAEKRAINNYETENIKKLFKTSGMNEIDIKMLDLTFQGTNKDRYENIMNKIKYFNINKNMSFFVAGKTGTGKTMTACHALNEVIKKGYIGKKIQANEYYSLVKESYRNKNIGMQLKIYETCDFLVLDDLGTEPTNQDAINNIVALIDKRYCNNKSTFITTNIATNQIRERYGDRITSRFNTFNKYLIDGEDNRSK